MSDDTGGSIGFFESQAIRTIVREEIEKALAKIMHRPTKCAPDAPKRGAKVVKSKSKVVKGLARR